MLFAGGGVKKSAIVGATDELGLKRSMSCTRSVTCT